MAHAATSPAAADAQLSSRHLPFSSRQWLSPKPGRTYFQASVILFDPTSLPNLTWQPRCWQNNHLSCGLQLQVTPGTHQTGQAAAWILP